MSERPILFSAPMIRAILAGTKTQTRRVVRWPVLGKSDGSKRRVFTADDVAAPALLRLCPFGVPGDRLWVRETWAPSPDPGDRAAIYQADRPARYVGEVWRWRPSIHMPRWASRLTLEVTGVRVERLQSISEEDAQAEGIRGPLIDPELDRMVGGQIGVMPRAAFAKGWDYINGKRAPWASNQFVWVVSFRRVQP